MKTFDPHQNQKLRSALPYIRKIYASLFASIMALSFSNIIFFAYLQTVEYNEIEFQSFAPRAFVIILFPVFVVLTAALVFNYFDNLDLFNKRDYFRLRESGKQTGPFIFEKQYIIGFAIEMLFAALIFTNGYHMALSFFFPGISIYVARLLAVATMAIIRPIQLWDLKDKWDAEIENPLFVEKAVFKRNRDPEKFKVRQMIWQPIGYFIVFGLACNFVTFFGFPMLMVVFMIILSPNMWWTLFSIPIIIIAITFAIRLIHNTRKRAILIKKLHQMQREGLAEVNIKGSKYLSATFTFLPFSVKITDKEGEVYNCLVISASKINAPIYFNPDEYMVEHGFHLRGGALLAKGGAYMQAVDISKMGGRENPTNLVFGFRMAHKLKFPDIDGKKAVILNPTPTVAFSVYGREYFSIDTGEDMKNYTIYTATGLFNHIERQSRKGKRDYDY